MKPLIIHCQLPPDVPQSLEVKFPIDPAHPARIAHTTLSIFIGFDSKGDLWIGGLPPAEEKQAQGPTVYIKDTYFPLEYSTL